MDDSVSNDLGRIRHAWSATRVQTASCCPCAAHDQLQKKIGVAVSQQQIRRLALFSAARTTSIWSNALVSCSTPRKQGTRSPCFVAPAFRGAREKLRRATGPKVTLHLALFFLCGTKVYGTAWALHFFSIVANPISCPLGLCCQTEQV